MDPQACYDRLCNALDVGNVDEAASAAGDLDRWFRKGGFRPEGIPFAVWHDGLLGPTAHFLTIVARRLARGDS